MIHVCALCCYIDEALHCIIKCSTPNNVKATKLERKRLAGLVACVGGLKIISSIGQEKGTEGKKVLDLCSQLNGREFGRPRHRWKMLTSSYIRCNVTDAVDLAQVRVNTD